MKARLFTGSLLLAAVAGNAGAACTAPSTRVEDPFTALGGMTVCGIPGPGYSGDAGDRWQEEHFASGQLWDYKLGDGHAIDPRKQVGTWSATTGRAASVNYIYNDGSNYGFALFDNGDGTYSFCNTAAVEVVHATLQPIGGPCP